LTLAGVQSQRLKYSLVNVHLAHPRPYYSPRLVEQQMRRLKRIRAQRIVRIPQGIRPLAAFTK
jgi:hypothetical protein